MNLHLFFCNSLHPFIKLSKTFLYFFIFSGLFGMLDLLYKINNGYFWSILPLFITANLLQKSSPACVPIPPKIPIIKYFFCLYFLINYYSLMQELYVDDLGTGTPLVLVHGFLGSSAIWSPQKLFLNKYFRLIVPALPGFGESSKLNSLDSIEDMASSIIKVLQKKNIKKFYLMGHSMGGMVAQEIVKKCKDKILKLICYSTGSIGDIPGRFETINDSINKLNQDGIEITASRISKKWFVKGEKDKNFYLCEQANKATSLDAAINALIAMKRWNGKDSLKNIKVKTLIIWGDLDTAYNFDQVNMLKNNILKSEMKVFENCSHNVHLEDPEKFNLIVKEFLND